MSFTKIIVSSAFPSQYFTNIGADKEYEIISLESFINCDKGACENALLVLPQDFLLFSTISDMAAIPNTYIVAQEQLLARLQNYDCESFKKSSLEDDVKSIIETRENLFKDCVFYAMDGVSPLSYKFIPKVVTSMGGVLSETVDEKVDFVLGDFKFFIGTQPEIREDTVVVSPEWLGICFSQGNRLNMSDYSYNRPLHNVTICVTGCKKEDRIAIKKKVESNGGVYNPSLNIKCTYLLAANSAGPKCDFARKHSIKMMRPEFLDFVLEKGGVVLKGEMQSFQIVPPLKPAADEPGKVSESAPIKTEKTTKTAKTPAAKGKGGRVNKKTVSKREPNVKSRNLFGNGVKNAKKSEKLTENDPKNDEKSDGKGSKKLTENDPKNDEKSDGKKSEKSSENPIKTTKKSPKRPKSENSSSSSPESEKKKTFSVKTHKRCKTFGVLFDEANSEFLCDTAVFLAPGLTDDERNRAVAIVRVSGATRFPALDDDVSLVLAPDNHFESAEPPPKINNDIPIVSINWLFDCYERKTKLGLDDYILKPKQPVPRANKRSFSAFNVSVEKVNTD